MIINQVFNQIWEKIETQDNIVRRSIEHNGERLQVIEFLDGKRLAMRGPAKLWQNKKVENEQ